nr:hypothetical protein [Chloroflexota bacterium]
MSEREPSPRIAALILDMDGLLVDSESLAEGAVVEFLLRHGFDTQPEILRRLLGRRPPEAVAFLAERFSLPGALPE